MSPESPIEHEPASDRDDPLAPPTEMVELDRRQCLRLLALGRFGRVSVGGGEHAAPIIRPVNYVFDDRSQSVAFRTADGTKLHALLREANAAFEIDGVDPETRTGWSVIITGVTEEVTSGPEKRRLDRLPHETWAPGTKPRWIRIRAWTVSGRQIALQADDIPRPPRSSQ